MINSSIQDVLSLMPSILIRALSETDPRNKLSNPGVDTSETLRSSLMRKALTVDITSHHLGSPLSTDPLTAIHGYTTTTQSTNDLELVKKGRNEVDKEGYSEEELRSLGARGSVRFSLGDGHHVSGVDGTTDKGSGEEGKWFRVGC
jgi:hypothetical protein